MALSLTTVNNLPWDNITNRILEIVAGAPGCQITYLAELIPDVTLEEIIVTLCYLKRSGQLDVVAGRQGAVTVTLSPTLFH